MSHLDLPVRDLAALLAITFALGLGAGAVCVLWVRRGPSPYRRGLQFEQPKPIIGRRVIWRDESNN